MEDNDLVLLEDEFSVYPGRNLFKVTLTKTKIVVEDQDKLIDVIDLSDVIGCHILQTKKKNSTTSFFCIFSYPLKKKKLGSGLLRQRQTKTFAVNRKRSYEENIALTEVWKMAIKRLIRGDEINSRRDLESGSLPTRNLLVLVNPFSGRKKALSMYKEKVRPMFVEAEIKHTVIKTEYAGHAIKIAKEMKLNNWDGIVIVSGDGLVHEVINGLMDREDWREAIKTPIGIVPGGSGNALAASVVYASTGQMVTNNLELDCIFEVVKGHSQNMNLIAMETFAGKKCYSFLNFAWGFIADVDIESERFRKLGPVRFTIGCAIRVANMRMYQARISYLPAVNNKSYSFGRSHSMQEFSLNGNEPMLSRTVSLPDGQSTSMTFGSRFSLSRKSVKSRTDENAFENDVQLVRAIQENSLNYDVQFHTADVSQNQASSSSENNSTSDQPTVSSSVETTSATSKVAGTSEIREAGDSSNTLVGNSKAPSSSTVLAAENDCSSHNYGESGDATNKTVDNGGVSDINENKVNSTPDNEYSRKNELLSKSGNENDVMRTNGTVETAPQAWKDSAIQYHLRAPLDADPPEEWVTLESEFVWVTAVYLSHLGYEMSGIPAATLDDDVIYIYTLRYGIGKPKMTNVLFGFENGTQIERGGEFSSVIPCRAVRLEPFSFISGHMTVDGELVPHCPIQASITPHKIPVMTSK